MKIDMAFIRQQMKPLAAMMGLLALLIGIVLLFAEPGERLGYVILAVVLVSLSFAGALFPGVYEIVFRRLLEGAGVIWLWLFLISGSLMVLIALSETLLASDSKLLQVLVLTTWGLLLLSAAFVVMYGRTRESLFKMMRSRGILAPLVYSSALFIISLQFFAVATFLLHQSESLTLTLGSAKALSSDAVGDFFLWHFLNAMPLLRITDTLLWDPPLTYDHPAVGWILLAFKISVISPVIVAFSWSWKRFKKAPTEAQSQVGKSQGLSSVGIPMPPSFNSASHDAVNAQVSQHSSSNPRAWRSFAAAWNALAYRWLDAAEADEIFTQSVKRSVSPPPSERRHQDDALFRFFTASASALETFYFSTYCAGALIDQAAFPLGSPKDLKRYPNTVASFYAKQFPGDPLSNAMASLLTTAEYQALIDFRNFLAHRGSPPKDFHAGGDASGSAFLPSNPQDVADAWAFGLQVTPNTILSVRAWLEPKLFQLMGLFQSFCASRI